MGIRGFVQENGLASSVLQGGSSDEQSKELIPTYGSSTVVRTSADLVQFSTFFSTRQQSPDGRVSSWELKTGGFDVPFHQKSALFLPWWTLNS
ncbi:hypothetical protein AVEN_93508-1 [Araneus ventricosus]|uniref:Uncharacterized protein n=1 Tax=Araneus ventricosus TaxID=182803 RepID=A0A4Y2AQE6_ARAVE|nr:hypothetical protein AVEN_93508-1 [Araneus ventricosus]